MSDELLSLATPSFIVSATVMTLKLIILQYTLERSSRARDFRVFHIVNS